MKMYNIVIGVLFWLVSSLVSAQDELSSYLQTAAENNPGLKARFNEYMAALEIAPQVKSLPDPQLAFGYFIQPVETRVGPQQFKISASQMFPWFGTLKAGESWLYRWQKQNTRHLRKLNQCCLMMSKVLITISILPIKLLLSLKKT
jgi:hypothetical protein